MASQPQSLPSKMTLQNTSSSNVPAGKNSLIMGKSSPKNENEKNSSRNILLTVGIIAVNIRKSMQKNSMAALLYTFDASFPENNAFNIEYEKEDIGLFNILHD